MNRMNLVLSNWLNFLGDAFASSFKCDNIEQRTSILLNPLFSHFLWFEFSAFFAFRVDHTTTRNAGRNKILDICWSGVCIHIGK